MYKVYQVKDNDTLESISSKFSIEPQHLIDLNGTSIVLPGSFIVVPSNESIFSLYTVKSGDTIYEIARRNNVSYEILLKLNGLDKNDYIYPGQSLIIPKENISLYITEASDTLYNVAKKMNTDLKSIVDENETIYLLPEQLIIKKY